MKNIFKKIKSLPFIKQITFSLFISSIIASGIIIFCSHISNSSAALPVLKVYQGGTGFGIATSGYAIIGNNTNSLQATSSMFISPQGNVGIGTTTPQYKLDIADGFINVSDKYGYKQDGNLILYASSTNSSTLVGDGAGASMLADGIQNTYIGFQAGNSSTSSDNNTFVGYQAGVTNTTGEKNTFVGMQAGGLNTTGSTNTALGYWALVSNTTGASNSAFGENSLTFNTTGTRNTAVGSGALFNNISGTQNTGIGMTAGFGNTTGSFNNAVGDGALEDNTTGSNNAVYGDDAALEINPSSNNTIIGVNAGSGVNGVSANSNNSIFGFNSGYGLTSGNKNVLFGAESGKTLTTGENNVFIGYQAGYTSTSTTNNVFVGRDAGYDLDGQFGYNTYVGWRAGASSTNAFSSVALGYQALENNQGNYNTAVGSNALQLNTTGFNNLAFGDGSLQSNTTGRDNTAFGSASLLSNTTGDYNVSVGSRSLIFNTTGQGNVAIGYEAGEGVSSASDISSNVMIGYYAGNNLQTGADNNVIIGYESGLVASTATNNTLLGYKSGDALTTGSNNIIIGYDIDATSSDATSFLNIGDTIYGDMNSGYVGIGTSSPTDEFVIESDKAGYSIARIKNWDSGALSGTAWYAENDAGYWGATGMSSSGNTLFGAGNDFGIYSQGYGNFNITNDGNFPIVFNTDVDDAHSVTGYEERMRLTAPGNLGIATTVPAYKLDVNGIVQATKYLGNISSTTLESLALPGAAYPFLNDYITVTGSAGRVTGGELSDNGDGTIAVAAGQGVIRTSDSATGQLNQGAWIASSSITIATSAITYIGIEFSEGTLLVVTDSDNTWTRTTQFPLGSAVGENGIVHALNNPLQYGDSIARVQHRLYETERFSYAERVGGGIVGNTGTRNLTLSPTEFYDRTSEFVITAKDTSDTDFFSTYYRRAGGGFILATSTQWDNTQYDDGSGSLATLTNNKYGVFHVYQDVEDDAGSMIYVYGRGNYVSVGAAEQEAEPTPLPLRVQDHSVYIGLVVFQESGSTFTSNISKLETSGGGGVAVSDHGNLSGLTDDDHEQYILENGTRAFSGDVDFGGNNISNIAEATTTLLTVTTSKLGTIISGTWNGDAIAHEYGGLEADVSSYAGLISITGGSTVEVNSILGINNLLVNESVASTTWDGASSIVTVGTLTGGATGAGFTVDLDTSTLTCTNCLDISDNTNLDAGTSLTLSGDTLNVDDDFLKLGGDVATAGAYDFGEAGVVVEAPQDGTVDATGEFQIDTASSTWQFYDGSTVQVMPGKQEFAFAIASTTFRNFSIISIWQDQEYDITITNILCNVTGETDQDIFLSDGTNDTETIVCDTTGATDDGSIVNAEFKKMEKMYVEMGTAAGDPDWLYGKVKYIINN